MTTGTATALPQMNVTRLPVWDEKLLSTLIIAHIAPNPDPDQPPTTHVMARWLAIPDDEQLVLVYGYDGNDGFRAAWSEIIKAAEYPEVAATRQGEFWQLHELFDWLGGPADMVAQTPLLDKAVQ